MKPAERRRWGVRWLMWAGARSAWMGFVSLAGACDVVPARTPATATPAIAATTEARPARSPTRPDIGFRSQRLYGEHFDKHGREFGAIDRREYLRLAQTLRDAPLSDDVVELSRPDGTKSRFERSSGSFLAYNDDLTIRTFFKPNDGESYFRRQARRRPNR